MSLARVVQGKNIRTAVGRTNSKRNKKSTLATESGRSRFGRILYHDKFVNLKERGGRAYDAMES